MTIPSLETIVTYTTLFVAIFGALLAAIWLSLIIWAFRDMRLRSRDPFAQLFAALVVAILPLAGILIYLILRPPETLAQAYERALEEEALLQEIEERPRCPGCSRAVESGWMICPHCHTQLRLRCPDCSSLVELHWSLCPYCGNVHLPARASAEEHDVSDNVVYNDVNDFVDDVEPAPSPDDDYDDGWPIDDEPSPLSAQ